MKQVLQHRVDSTFSHYDVNRNGVIELAAISSSSVGALISSITKSR